MQRVLTWKWLRPFFELPFPPLYLRSSFYERTDLNHEDKPGLEAAKDEEEDTDGEKDELEDSVRDPRDSRSLICTSNFEYERGDK